MSEDHGKLFFEAQIHGYEREFKRRGETPPRFSGWDQLPRRDQEAYIAMAEELWLAFKREAEEAGR